MRNGKILQVKDKDKVQKKIERNVEIKKQSTIK